MARPRKIPFYENREPIDPFSGQEWLVTYDRNCQKVVDYLVQGGVGNTIYYSTIRCLEKLRNFLSQNNTIYSGEEANRWFRDTGPYPKGYQSVLFRLQDIFDYGKIQPVNAFPVSFPYYAHLQCLWKKEIEDYLLTLDYKEASLTQIRNCVARFLYRIQSSGIRHPSELSFGSLESYLETDGHRSRNSDARYTYAISISSFLWHPEDYARRESAGIRISGCMEKSFICKTFQNPRLPGPRQSGQKASSSHLRSFPILFLILLSATGLLGTVNHHAR